MTRRILKKHSTKHERIFYELLKELHIQFKHRWLINGKEIDFVIGKYAIELDGHLQNSEKNIELKRLGYIPIHFNNLEIINNRITIKTWLEQIFIQKQSVQVAT